MRTYLIFLAAWMTLQINIQCFSQDEEPAWVKTQTAIVSTGSDIVSSVADTKKIKASDASLKGAGPRAARKQQAEAVSNLIDDAGKINKTTKVAGKALTVIDNVKLASEVAGHVYEGNYSTASAKVVDEGAKALTASAGAAVGAKTMAVAGSFFGPVGTVVGAAVGAAGGAIIASAGYDLTVGDKLGKTVESGLDGNKTKADYVDDARAAREAHFAKQAQEKRDKQAELDKAKAARAEHLAKQAEEQKAKQEQIDKTKEAQAAQLAKLAEEQKIKDRKAAEAEQQARKKSKPKPESQPAAATSDKKPEPEAAKPQPKDEKKAEPPRDTSIPVIPVDCKISITLWGDTSPEYKLTINYTILDGKVTGGWHKDYGNGVKYTGIFSGTIKDNVISGVDKVTSEPMHYSSKDFEQTTYSSGTTTTDTTLNLDGTISVSGTSTWSWRVEVIRGEWPKDTPRQRTNSDTIKTSEVTGRWHIISKEEKKAAGKGK